MNTAPKTSPATVSAATNANCLPPSVVALICEIAANRGVSPSEVIAGAFGLTLAPIDAKFARRFREIEHAADIEPGSILDSLLEVAEHWWSPDEFDGGQLHEWIFGGWEISDAASVETNLAALQEKWRGEDAADTARKAD